VANFNSNLIATSTPAKAGIYPSVALGQVAIPAATTFALNDTIPLCNLGANTYIASVAIDLPILGTTLTLTLRDTQGTPVNYVTASNKGQAGGILTLADFNVRGSLGTVYNAPSVLQLVAAAAGGSAVGPVTIFFEVMLASL
jgi:hypothetical protein